MPWITVPAGAQLITSSGVNHINYSAVPETFDTGPGTLHTIVPHVVPIPQPAGTITYTISNNGGGYVGLSPAVTVSPAVTISDLPTPPPIHPIEAGPGSGLLVADDSPATPHSNDYGALYVDGYPAEIYYRKNEMPEQKEQWYNKKINRLIPFGKQEGEIGLEIECEGTHLFKAPFVYWSCHGDGSLREIEGHQPVEYVLKQPLKYDELEKALRYLEHKLKDAGSSVVKSYRTSVHVHVNVQQLTVRELYNFILLYLIFEEVLVEWSGPERAGNLFCLRAKDSDFFVTMLELVLKNDSFKYWKEEYRYSACNVASVTKFGSLEFRSLRGTVDVDLILTWVRMLLLVKEKALEYDNPIDIADDFVRLGPLPFFRQVFSNSELGTQLEGTSGLSGKLWDGMRIMRDVAHTVSWEKPLQKKDDQNDPQGVVEEPVRSGQLVNTPWGTRDVKASYADIGPIKFRVVDGVWAHPSEMYSKTIPTGYTIYFVNNLPGEYLGAYCCLDIRPGPIEVYVP